MNTEELIGGPADESPEFVVLAVERRGWFTSEAVTQSRRSFTWSGFPPNLLRTMAYRWVEPPYVR